MRNIKPQTVWAKVEHQIQNPTDKAWITFCYTNEQIELSPFMGTLKIVVTDSEFDPNEQTRLLVTFVRLPKERK